MNNILKMHEQYLENAMVNFNNTVIFTL